MHMNAICPAKVELQLLTEHLGDRKPQKSEINQILEEVLNTLFI